MAETELTSQLIKPYYQNSVKSSFNPLGQPVSSLSDGFVSVVQFGAAGDGKTDSTEAIQGALDSGAGVISIPAGDYLISGALYPREGQELRIDGTLRLADAFVSGLAQDVAAGAERVRVTDVTGFRVGQWVVLVDDDSTGWNLHETRVRGDCGRIVAIEGDSVQLSGGLNLGYRVSRGARLATHSSVILIDGSSRVKLTGRGVIDANKSGHLDVRPMVLRGCGVRQSGRIGGDGGEEIRAGCGVASTGRPYALEHIVIENLTVRNASEHNICLVGTRYARVEGTVCERARDKNITLLDSCDVRVVGNIAADSEHEDGIMLHQQTGNKRVLIQGNLCRGNPRQGIAVGKMESQVHLQGNLCADNGCHIFLGGEDCSSTGDSCVGECYQRFPREADPPGVLLSGERIRVSNLGISGDRRVMVQIHGSRIQWSGGSITGTGEAAEDGCGLFLHNKSASGGVAKDVLISAVAVDGVKRVYDAEDGCERVELRDCPGVEGRAHSGGLGVKV